MESKTRLQLFYTEMESPLGPLTLFASEKGLCSIEFGKVEQAMLKMKMNKHFLKHEFTHNDEKLSDAMKQLKEYFYGRRTSFQLPLDLRGTPFQLKVWNELQHVHYGETMSYKRVAELIGKPKAVRAVGGANNQNPIPIIIPCHRVIGSNGALVGYGGGIEKKEFLLNFEKQFLNEYSS
ncbi:methylated-DNA--[protein]-cysteine S-methyltransferase [Pueribacillus sp. YX66]|uniref:methylated-DNA--[protein]-cysteine S-methyltransferase n=1 Tax=Pueribacillus sp. YX66 TaxID=3229242 RepID=UPI00358D1598